MTTTYLAKDHDIFIGIDVDKNSFSFTVKDHFDMKKSKKIPSNPEYLCNYINNTFPDKRVLCAYEAGPTGFHLYDYLTEKEIPCMIISPSSIPKPPNERVKNNRIDSCKLAQHISTGELKPIRVPQGAYRELRHLVSIREIHARNCKASKQRIKALLLSESLYTLIRDPNISWSNRHIKNLKQIQCSDAVRERLNMLLMDLEYARGQILNIHRIIKDFCDKHESINNYIRYLRSIPGIGFVTAVTLLARIGDPQNLKNVRELGAFVGLVPTEYSTGDDINKGSITHLGDKTLRFLLIESAWVAIRKNTELKQFYYRIKGRHHPSIASKKAITAVARKLTRIIYKVLKEQRMYIPLTQN